MTCFIILLVTRSLYLLNALNTDHMTLPCTRWCDVDTTKWITYLKTQFVDGKVSHGAIDSSVIPFGKIGFHSWDAEASLSVGSLNVRIADDGTDPFYGAGVTYRVRENMLIRGEYESFDFDGDPITFLSFGLVIVF